MGPGEISFWLTDSLFPANFMMIAEVDGPLNRQNLQASLDAVQAGHPLPRFRISEKALNTCFDLGCGPLIRLVQLSHSGYSSHYTGIYRIPFERCPRGEYIVIRSAFSRHPDGGAGRDERPETRFSRLRFSG